jgi:hypothetical protein
MAEQRNAKYTVTPDKPGLVYPAFRHRPGPLIVRNARIPVFQFIAADAARYTQLNFRV